MLTFSSLSAKGSVFDAWKFRARRSLAKVQQVRENDEFRKGKIRKVNLNIFFLYFKNKMRGIQ